MDNLWSTLFMTGYLTQRGEPVGNRYDLAIPNQEIRQHHHRTYFANVPENVKNDGTMADSFCSALEAGKCRTGRSSIYRIYETDDQYQRHFCTALAERKTFIRESCLEF